MREEGGDWKRVAGNKGMWRRALGELYVGAIGVNKTHRSTCWRCCGTTGPLLPPSPSSGPISRDAVCSEPLSAHCLFGKPFPEAMTEGYLGVFLCCRTLWLRRKLIVL